MKRLVFSAEVFGAGQPPRQCSGLLRHLAFTLLELLVVIALIGILAAMLLPALGKAKSQAISITCLNNLKQLQVCWHMYIQDDADVIPPNNFVYSFTPGTTNAGVLAEDDLTWCRGLAPLDTNDITSATSLLYTYNQNAAIYHCPADHSTVDGYPGLLRKRSYNVSNSDNCAADNHFRVGNEIPSPAALFVFVDTDENDIWDSTFGTMPQGSWWGNYWLDIPADRHKQGCNLTFADGHAEHWKWLAPKSGLWLGCPAWNENDLQDLRRLQQHIKGAGGN